MAWCQQTFWNFLCKPRPLPLSRSLWRKWHKVSRNPSKLYHGGGQAAVQNQAFPCTHWRWTFFQGLVFICVSLPFYSYLLDKKKIEGNFVDSIFKMNAIHKSLEWAILTGLLSVTGCNRKGFPFSRTLKETLPSDILLRLLFILSDTSLIYFPSLLLQ